jgi:hypothetical protein
VDQRTETTRATAAPTGGELARGGNPDPASGSTVNDVASAAYQSQTSNVFALKLKDELLGEWINEAVVPGVNFGWAPAPEHLIVFARRDGSRRDTGALTLLDDEGHRQEIAGTKGALLPAFSDDGARLAWVTHSDKKHYAVTIGAVEIR